MRTNCTVCNTEVNRKPSQLKKSKKVYCSMECRKSDTKKIVALNCANCGTSVERHQSQIDQSKTGRVFCSHKCSAEISNTERGDYGKTQYRINAFRELPHRCNRCDFDALIEVLQVHHIDRNRENGNVNNLEILCPTCHAIEHFNSNDGGFWNLKKE